MKDHEFKQLLYKGSLGKIISGLFIFSFGSVLLNAAITIPGHENSKFMAQFGTVGIVILAIASIFMIFLGVRNFYKVYSTHILIKNGRHKLVNAVLSNDQNYILWMYPKEEVRGKSGIVDQEIWVHSNDGKYYILDVKNRDHAVVVLRYLISKFPNALLGNESEHEKIYKEKLKRLSKSSTT